MLSMYAIARKIFGTGKQYQPVPEIPKRQLAKSGPLNLHAFNLKFIAANKALTGGNTDALKAGISLLIESLDEAGEFAPHVVSAIQELHCALSHHDRADIKGPWNRDLSEYGVSSWKKDLYDRDDALRRAWPHIETINNALKSNGLGWHY